MRRSTNRLFFPERPAPRSADGRRRHRGRRRRAGALPVHLERQQRPQLQRRVESLVAIDLEAFFRSVVGYEPPDASAERRPKRGGPTRRTRFCDGLGMSAASSMSARGRPTDFPCRRLGPAAAGRRMRRGPIRGRWRCGSATSRPTSPRPTSEPVGDSPRSVDPGPGRPERHVRRRGKGTVRRGGTARRARPRTAASEERRRRGARRVALCSDSLPADETFATTTTLDELPREPFNVRHQPKSDNYRYAFIAHSSGPALSIIDLDGLSGRRQRAAGDRRHQQQVFSAHRGYACSERRVRPGDSVRVERLRSRTANDEVPGLQRARRSPRGARGLWCTARLSLPAARH